MFDDDDADDYDDYDFDDDSSDDSDDYDGYDAAVDYYGYDPEDPETYDADDINDFHNFYREPPGIEEEEADEGLAYNLLAYSIDRSRAIPALFVNAGMGIEDSVFIPVNNQFYYVLKAVALWTEKEYLDNPIHRIIVRVICSEDGEAELGIRVVRQMISDEPGHNSIPLSPNDPSHVDYIPP